MSSLNYGDLLHRQAELQRLGGMLMPGVKQARVALLTEVGELAQECKPDWAWWKKPGEHPQADRERVLAEAADALHFMLLLDLAYDEDDCLECPDWGNLGHSGAYRDSDAAGILDTLFEGAFDPYVNAIPGWDMTDALCALLALYGFTPEDLARAYWEKSEENLRRWAAVAGQP